MTTWQNVATARGFRDNGDHTWTAPNGTTQVSEDFVRRECQPARPQLLFLVEKRPA